MGESLESAESFVGRKAEIDELRRALDETRRGHGGLCLIAGEPEIGKTRLSNELALYGAQLDIKVAWGRSFEGSGGCWRARPWRAAHLHLWNCAPGFDL